METSKIYRLPSPLGVPRESKELSFKDEALISYFTVIIQERPVYFVMNICANVHF